VYWYKNSKIVFTKYPQAVVKDFIKVLASHVAMWQTKN
jgi:hypothetical protein